MSDDWLRGPLAPQVKPAQIKAAARRIAEAFPTEQPVGTVYHPCHRVVLELSSARPAQDGIPEDALVVEGDRATTAYTLSLFRAASGTCAKTWGDLVASVGGEDAAWRHQLDQRYAAALREELFSPTTATLRAFDPEQRQRRYYRPILFEVTCTPPCLGEAAGETGRPGAAGHGGVRPTARAVTRGRPGLQPGAHQRPVRLRGLRGLLRERCPSPACPARRCSTTSRTRSA